MPLGCDGKRGFRGTLVTDVLALADVSSLVGCSSLHTLDLSGTRVTDLSSLAGCTHSTSAACGG